ncbi:MAG TPA: hypothetical protein VEU62_20995 [Bryobacterales bacterium]|nr:hypothetical protein [Bryobacterales bacterium]
METQLSLSEAEWELVIELLEGERRELPSEIRHTDATNVHAELKRRLEMVDRLLERLRGTAKEKSVDAQPSR